ncbi:MAG: kinase, partial [Acidobacteriota bacterium]
EIPSRGTGLGSSSAFLVALLLALHTWLGENVTPETLAREAYHVEREVLKEPGGKQDQYAAAYGGINLMEFFQDESVSVKPILLPRDKREELERSLVMFYTNREMPSSSVHEAQIAELDGHVDAYKRMREIAYETADALSYMELEGVGRLMHENWSLKRGLANGITDGEIDSIYEKGIRAGAIGGKLMGAGGRGFMLFLVPKERKRELMAALSEYRAEEFRIEPLGARVVYAEDF